MRQTNINQFRAITIAEAIIANANGQTVYVEDGRCTNIVEARLLTIKYRPRLKRYDATYKVALWWRSFSTSNDQCEAFYLPKV